jgi:glyoxylase-like metal-dependent hydrolase (beta-lactamase superfamily II)
MHAAEPLVDRTIGRVTVLFGRRGGRYPEGNSLWIQGAEEAVIVDPALGLWERERQGTLPPADRILLSHCHEDHIAGNPLYPEAACHVHEADRPGLASLDGMMAIYGYPEPILAAFRPTVVERFHYQARPNALPFRDGDVFDLGGGVRVRVLHAPGHTRGHSFFWIEPEDVLYLGDVDLSSFGPYYGDAWSSLEDFVGTLAALRKLDPRHWATFHHVGVIDDRAVFDARLERFAARIAEREKCLLEFLADAPRTLPEIAAHRFVYRPQDAVPFAEAVEVRSMGQHLERLLHRGAVHEVGPGHYRRA